MLCCPWAHTAATQFGLHKCRCHLPLRQHGGRRWHLKFKTRAGRASIACTRLPIALPRSPSTPQPLLATPADRPSLRVPAAGFPGLPRTQRSGHAISDDRWGTRWRASRAPPHRRRRRQPWCAAGRHRGPTSGRGAGDLPSAQEGEAAGGSICHGNHCVGKFPTGRPSPPAQRVTAAAPAFVGLGPLCLLHGLTRSY